MPYRQCTHAALMSASKGSLTFADFSHGTLPKRCLDIGTGVRHFSFHGFNNHTHTPSYQLGLWVVSCAKEWPETRFVSAIMPSIVPALTAA